MTTTPTHSEALDAAYALLAEGERQIAARQYREGSANVYQAALTALRAAAKSHGWPCETYEDAHNVIYRLDGIEPPPESSVEAIQQARRRIAEPLPVFSLLFTTVYCFQHHGRTGSPDGTLPTTFWEPEDYANSLPLVKKFIDLLVSAAPTLKAYDPR